MRIPQSQDCTDIGDKLLQWMGQCGEGIFTKEARRSAHKFAAVLLSRKD